MDEDGFYNVQYSKHPTYYALTYLANVVNPVRVFGINEEDDLPLEFADFCRN